MTKCGEHGEHKRCDEAVEYVKDCQKEEKTVGLIQHFARYPKLGAYIGHTSWTRQDDDHIVTKCCVMCGCAKFTTQEWQDVRDGTLEPTDKGAGDLCCDEVCFLAFTHARYEYWIFPRLVLDALRRNGREDVV